MNVGETVEISGHLMDSGVLARVLDDVLDYGCDYVIEKFDVGRTHDDESYARIGLSAPDESSLQRVLMRLQAGSPSFASAWPSLAWRSSSEEATIARRLGAGSAPSSAASVNARSAGSSAGCAASASSSSCTRSASAPADSACRMNTSSGRRALWAGEVGSPHSSADDVWHFEFMNSEVSSEKPQALLVRRIAERMREVKGEGEKVLWVAGPAVVHTGAAPAMVALVEAGYVDVLFAGNALAVHDIEAAMFGTSLGVDLSKGRGVEHGHEHHIRAINTIRKAGSIAAAVKSGVLTGGVMHALVTARKPFVLVGSVRDDGPLPDVYANVIDGQRAMREQLHGVGFAVMVATMLHSIATGNILPASIPLVCVDINPATVTKLADRGSAQDSGVGLGSLS